jgi:histidine triad (HIT) family protein
MSLEGTYDTNNVFARILRGEIPAAQVMADEVAVAFMDAFPQAEGHTLVVPRYPARNLFELPVELIGPYMERVQRVAIAVRAAFSPEGIILSQFNGTPAGQTVFHLHFHIIPRWSDRPLGGHGSGMADPAVLAERAARVRAALGA